MAPVAQEPEITLAQRLASNDKPVRNKALKTLRKYIHLRSGKVEDGFTSENLLKIWKGLFYCLWMQDKPLLQEELSHRISGLIHSFHTADNQLLYFATFLQTVKREWNGIDRLRMDKFFQLVRFMFREAFEALKRMAWESSAVNQFLQVFTEQLLQNPDQVPKGLQLHVLDLYMTELALVGTAELTANQNLTFIEPFCKTMAKTKDRFLLASISKNIFMTIADQAPYAIEDLMRELRQGGGGGGEDSDSGQASGEDDEEEELNRKAATKTKATKVNGISEELENSEEEIKDDLDLDSVGSEENDGVGPVLQFDYGAIADRLFELGSHLNIRNINRTKMYSLVKIFRDLSEGVFPKNEENGKMSDASDDKMFNKKKSKKKKRNNPRPTTDDESAAKKSKAGHRSDLVKDDLLNDGTKNIENKNKEYREKATDISGVLLEAGESDLQKRKDKKLKEVEEEVAHEFQLVLEESDGENGCKAVREPKTGQAVKEKTKKKMKMDVGEEKMDGEANVEQISLQVQSETTETEALKGRKKKRKRKNLCSSLQEVQEVQSLPKEPNAGDKVGQDNSATMRQQGTCTALEKKVKRKKVLLKSCSQEAPAILLDSQDDELSICPCPASEEASTTTNRKRKIKKLMSASQDVDTTSQDSRAEVTAPPAVELTKKSKKKKVEEETGSELDQCSQPKKAKNKKRVSSNDEVEAATVRPHTMRQKESQESQPEQEANQEPKAGTEVPDTVTICTHQMNSFTPLKKEKKKRKLQTDSSQSNGHEEELGGMKAKNIASTSVTPKKLKTEKASAKSDFVSFQTVLKTPSPLFCKTKPKGSVKKFQTPKSETKKVTFGLKNNKTAEFRKMDSSSLVSPVGSSRVAFDPKKLPASGVLKSPLLAPVLSVKKSAAKKRATAADFF